MGRHQYRRTVSLRPHIWLLGSKLAETRGRSLSSIVECLLVQEAALQNTSVSDEEVEAFKAKCRESSLTEAEHKERSRARRLERMRKAVFG